MMPLNVYGSAQAQIVMTGAVVIRPLMYVALNYFKLTPPPWAVQVFWIVVVALVVILAIKLVFGVA